MATERETLKLLCKTVITRMENQKAISFPPRLRQIVQDEVFGLIGPFILTDQDIRERALAKVGASAEMLQDSAFTESDQYRTAKSVVKNNVGTEELNGFYFQKSPKFVANTIVQYLMRSSHIDDVYESDEDLEHKIVDMFKKFNASEIH
jgi:hypothetical protein